MHPPPALELEPVAAAHGHRFLVACTTPYAEAVVNSRGEELGRLEHIVVDAPSGRAAYAVVARGGVFGLGERLHAIPWSALRIDAARQSILLDVAAETLDDAPGFDDDHWPDMHDAAWAAAIRDFYRAKISRDL